MAILKPTQVELTTILAEHLKWARNEGGRRADLSEANLSRANLWRADLSRANLSGADLWRADLWGADLSEANLSEANLSEADLSGANLSGANLSEANLWGANLSEANLWGTCLMRMMTAYEWCLQNTCPMRSLAFRTLALGSRTISSPVMGGAGYQVGRLYEAPFFSHDRATDCHPGLYVAGGPDTELEQAEDIGRILVAFWLDELLPTQTKARVPRFRTVATREEFEALTAADLEPIAEREVTA